MKKLYILLIALTLAITMIVPVGVVNAGSGQIAVSGTIAFHFAGMSPPEELKVVGKGDIVMGWIAHNVVYTGDLEGTAQEILDFRLNVKTGYNVTDAGIQNFEGTLQGIGAGEFTAHVRHQGGADGSMKVEQTIISGTGALTNLRGTLIITVYNQGGVWVGDYSGKLHFAP